MKRICFLYNPSANRERSLHKFEKLKKATSSWSGVEYITTKDSNDLKKRAVDAAKRFDVVVACGGDGTVKDVAVSIMDTPAKLGIIPLGSGNDFSKSLGLNSNLNNSIRTLYKRETKTVDIGKCNDHYFINTLGFGFDGQANFYASQSSIGNGILRYAVAALKTNARMVPFEAEIHTDRSAVLRRLIMLTVANGRVEGGNFKVSSEASPFDGLLNLVTIDPVSKWVLPFLLPFLVVGKQKWIPYISETEIKKVTLNFKNQVYIHSDGEQIYTQESKFEISVLRAAIQVIC